MAPRGLVVVDCCCCTLVGCTVAALECGGAKCAGANSPPPAGCDEATMLVSVAMGVPVLCGVLLAAGVCKQLVVFCYPQLHLRN
jgi:hypothetical protein